MVLQPQQKIKVKSEVSVRTYQAHAGAYVQNSQLKPTTPHATNQAKKNVQMRVEKKERRKKTRTTENEARKITREQGGCSEVKAGDTALRKANERTRPTWAK